MLIDSHAHLTNEQMQDGLEGILERAGTVVSAVINIATNPEELRQGLALQEKTKTPRIYNAGATTPHDAEKEGELFFDEFSRFAREKKLIAIGETGLDYYYYKETAAIQKKIFLKYIHLAKETNLPLIIHCRDAFEDFFSIIDQEKCANGVLHCFTGSLEDAKDLINRNWLLSLSGIVTYKKSGELKEVAKWVPLDRLLIETDSPYLAPQSFRGKRNEPSFLSETAKYIAELRNISFEELSLITSRNAKTFFNLQEV